MPTTLCTLEMMPAVSIVLWAVLMTAVPYSTLALSCNVGAAAGISSRTLVRYSLLDEYFGIADHCPQLIALDPPAVMCTDPVRMSDPIRETHLLPRAFVWPRDPWGLVATSQCRMRSLGFRYNLSWSCLERFSHQRWLTSLFHAGNIDQRDWEPLRLVWILIVDHGCWNTIRGEQKLDVYVACRLVSTPLCTSTAGLSVCCCSMRRTACLVQATLVMPTLPVFPPLTLTWTPSQQPADCHTRPHTRCTHSADLLHD